jgi:hypothetical protein
MTATLEKSIWAGILLLFLLWDIILSVLFWRLLRHYRLLAGKTKKGGLEKVLTELIKSSDLTRKDISSLKDALSEIQQENSFNLKSWGLVRFNPFSETGGNQSFSLAVLDGHQSGLVITSLHTRDGTRVYAKLVNKGVAQDADLSKEELLAVKQAAKRRKK